MADDVNVLVEETAIYIGRQQHRITTDQLHGPHPILKLAYQLAQHDDVNAREIAEFIRISASIAGIDMI